MHSGVASGMGPNDDYPHFDVIFLWFGAEAMQWDTVACGYGRLDQSSTPLASCPYNATTACLIATGRPLNNELLNGWSWPGPQVNQLKPWS